MSFRPIFSSLEHKRGSTLFFIQWKWMWNKVVLQKCKKNSPNCNTVYKFLVIFFFYDFEIIMSGNILLSVGYFLHILFYFLNISAKCLNVNLYIQTYIYIYMFVCMYIIYLFLQFFYRLLTVFIRIQNIGSILFLKWCFIFLNHTVITKAKLLYKKVFYIWWYWFFSACMLIPLNAGSFSLC